jgi:predicted small metal-binding protein
MKTMTCKQLGGACDYKITAGTFGEMAEKAKEHAHEMAAANDEAHLKVMERMKEKMNDSEAMQEWMEQKKAEFDELPEDD